MNKGLTFLSREKQLEQMCHLYSQRQHVVIVGPAGIGKTALLRQLRQVHPLLYCEETSSLRRICDGIERQLGWNHCKLNLVERKNRLLACLGRRAELVAFDHVALTPPRVSRFMASLGDQIPIWIICRSTLRGAIGHVWEHLYKFTRVEIPPLSPSETRRLIYRAVSEGHIQPDSRAHARELHGIERGAIRAFSKSF